MSEDARATSFGVQAASYELARPDYPFEAVAWMLEPLPHGSRRIADVGAGTGKLTRVLAKAPDAEIVAIDPDAEMLATLGLTVPGVPTFIGTAEHLPLPDSSVDAVVLAQAWHWVEPIAASAEIGRVMRSGGVLGLIWNIRDERTDWVRRLTGIMHGSAAEQLLSGAGPDVAAPFGSLASEEWEWTRPITRSRLHELASSRSYVITAPDAEKQRIRREMDELFDELGIHGEDAIELPYITRAFRAVRE
ncbi:class I SAM-dependent methyltransferase [Microbacterium sp. GXF0217]